MEAASRIRFRFGHPIVSAVDGYGFEEDIRVGPADLNVVYQRQARLPADRPPELAYAEVVHPAAEYEDIARDQHPEGIDEKPASAKTQVRVGCDRLRLQPQIPVEENRFIKADDDDPDDEQARKGCGFGHPRVQQFGGRLDGTLRQPLHPGIPFYAEEVDHRDEDDQPQPKAVEKPPPVRPEENDCILKRDEDEKNDNQGPGQSRAVRD